MANEESPSRLACPCCGNLTLEGLTGHYDICPVCYWEDDPLQREEPAMAVGANVVSLRMAQENYRKFGASELTFRHLVRVPLESELKKSH